ncbi:MAG: pitrilysin family protein, partial [Armatimonadota bacterium]|nr:pitrilysin family protein [Armatimonadota bacterium]
IRRKNDHPAEVAGRVFAQTIYGKESPWAREPTLAGIRSIQREDLVAFHQRYFAPNNTVLAVVGDLSVEEMAQRVRRWLGDWESRKVEIPPVPPVRPAVPPEVILVPKEVSQVNVRIGHLGLPRLGPDHYSVQVMNYILGAGGFGSRLMREVRTNRGLAYAVWGYLGEGRDRGLFEMGAETGVETAAQGIQVMRETLAGLLSGPISPAELASAKDALLNSFVFAFQSRFQIASRQARFDVLGYPPDYLQTYVSRIAAVTPEAVQRAAQAHLHMDQLVVVAVGPRAPLEKALAQFGTVRVVPLAQAE